jgi:hypothetical protein
MSVSFGKNMSKADLLALLAASVVLIVFGVMASTSFTADISRFFTGSPTDKAIWMFLGGAVASIVGVVGLLRGLKYLPTPSRLSLYTASRSV